MSLINEMLRDLEARRAGELGRSDIQREIRPLPEVRRSGLRLPLLLGSAALLAGAGGAAWWQFGGSWQVPAEKQTAAPAALPQVATPQPVVLPPVVAEPAMPPMPPMPVATAEPLRLAPSLASVSSEAATAQPQPSNQLPPSRPMEAARVTVADKPAEHSAKPEAVSPPAKAATPASTQTNIEKTAVLATPRERADAEYRKAQALLAASQTQAALESLQAALRLDPSHAPVRQALVRLNLELRRIDDAVALLQEGIEILPMQTGWAISLARLLVERNDFVGAERALAHSSAYAAGNAEYEGFRGHLLNRLGQFRPAAEHYLAATRAAPGEGRWWFGLGQAMEGDGRPAEAREAFRRALAAGNLNADLAALAEQRIR